MYAFSIKKSEFYSVCLHPGNLDGPLPTLSFCHLSNTQRSDAVPPVEH